MSAHIIPHPDWDTVVGSDFEQKSFAIYADGPAPDTGDHVIQILTPDGRDFGPLGINGHWEIETIYVDPRFAPSYARPPAGHARISYRTSYSDVPYGSIVIVARPITEGARA